MPIAVVESAGDDRPLRRDAGQKLRLRGCDAAMMADLEQGALQAGFAQHGLFDGGFGVALKQN